MRVILDTSVLIAAHELGADEYAISAATLAELHFGVLVANNEPTRATRLQRLTVVERSFDAIPFDSTVARAYGECAAAVQIAGRNPRSRVFDLMIAATARAHGASVLTHNVGDFAGLEELVEIRSVS
jgi:predicted nucleic acid-binding protein